MGIAAASVDARRGDLSRAEGLSRYIPSSENEMFARSPWLFAHTREGSIHTLAFKHHIHIIR